VLSLLFISSQLTHLEPVLPRTLVVLLSVMIFNGYFVSILVHLITSNGKYQRDYIGYALRMIAPIVYLLNPLFLIIYALFCLIPVFKFKKRGSKFNMLSYIITTVSTNDTYGGDVMRKIFRMLILAVFTLFAISVFAELKVNLQSDTVVIGGKLPITVEVTGKDGKPAQYTLKAKLNLGGFDKPEVLTKGLTGNGKLVLNYLAPKRAGEIKITFTAETTDKSIFTQEVSIKVTEKDESEFSEQLKAQIDSFRGSVAIKKSNKTTWESITKTW